MTDEAVILLPDVDMDNGGSRSRNSSLASKEILA